MDLTYTCILANHVLDQTIHAGQRFQGTVIPWPPPMSFGYLEIMIIASSCTTLTSSKTTMIVVL